MDLAANHSIQSGGDVAGNSEPHERSGVNRPDVVIFFMGRSGREFGANDSAVCDR
jgi:hypothetical protein